MFRKFYTHWRSSYAGIPATIWFLSAVSLVNRCGSMVIAFVTLYLTQSLHFSIPDAGYVMGCFGVGAMCGAFLGGRLTDKWGYYPVQLWSLVLNGIALLLMMLVHDFWWMCCTVFLLSLVSEAFRPANSVAISKYSEPATRTRSISLYRMAVNLGWTVAPVLGGVLITAFGWPSLFWADGLTCILAALLLRWRMPSSLPEPAPEPGAEKAAPLVVLSPYRDRRYMWFLALTVLNGMVFMQIMWTVPVFFKETYHWTEAQIGLTTALNGLIVFMVEMPLIFRLEGRRSPLAWVRVGLILYALAYLMFLLPVAGIVAGVLFMIVISFGEIFVMPFSSNFVFSRATAGNRQGQYMALYTVAYSVANILAPLYGTQMIAHLGYPALWGSLAVVVAVVWLGVWRMERPAEAGEPAVLEASA
ncbi:MAG: MFS transporter [Saprospiraceae bacterium]